jgi:hypothetical protein
MNKAVRLFLLTPFGRIKRNITEVVDFCIKYVQLKRVF